MGWQRSWLTQALAASRAGEWWEYKLLPLLAAFYASATLDHLLPAQWGWGMVWLVLAIVPGAVFVGVVNDLTDRCADAAAAKPNRMAQVSPPLAALALAVPIAAGLAWCYLWRDRPALLAPYLAAWLAFAAYSAPPLRLKARGVLGALADAGGAHLFPALLAAALAADAIGDLPAPVWLLAVGAWAGGYGLRGIIGHQLADRANDAAAGIGTWAVRAGDERLLWFARWLAFPLELGGLAALLALTGSAAAWLALALYAAVALQQVRVWKLRPTLTAPGAKGFIAMADFYAVWLPLALLAGLAWRHPLAGTALLLAHLALFPRNVLRVARDLLRLEWVQARLILAALKSRPRSRS